jgi:hypothetical protein
MCINAISVLFVEEVEEEEEDGDHREVYTAIKPINELIFKQLSREFKRRF